MGADGRDFEPRDDLKRLTEMTEAFLEGRKGARLTILPGLRGVGKSTLLSQLHKRLLEKGVPDDRIFSFSIDEAELALGAGISDVVQGYERRIGRYLEETRSDMKTFLLLDEVQYDPQWGLALKVLYDRAPNVAVFATGSSALELEASADLARRGTFVRVLPLSLAEYLRLIGRTTIPADTRRRLVEGLFSSRDAKQAYERVHDAMESMKPALDSITPFDLTAYLKTGSMTSSLTAPDEESSFQFILGTTERIVNQDISRSMSFSQETRLKMSNLLTLLANSDRISYESLSRNLGLSKPTIILGLEAFNQAQVIQSIRAYGQPSISVRKTPRYGFFSPSMRAALMLRAGTWSGDHAQLGRLLEDAVALCLFRLRAEHTIGEYHIDPAAGGADFIVTTSPQQRVAIEVGYGEKDVHQLVQTAKKVRTRYNLLVSDGRLRLIEREEVLEIPRELFLLV